MKKNILFSILVIAGIAAAGWYVDKSGMHTNTSSVTTSDFQNYGSAPDFTGITHWLNSPPLTIADLKGKVVLIDFWTYSCINCIRTLPYVTRWYDTYKDLGFVVVGVHTPEFSFEKDTNNVAEAIKNFGIHYPVAQDNNYATWNAYNNQYWPAEYLIDQNGNIVHVHFGEGEYDVTENAVRQLLGLTALSTTTSADSQLSDIQSPEMYFGTNRLQNLAPGQNSSSKNFSFPQNLNLNNFALEGNWQFNPENITLLGNSGKIELKFHAGKVHMVASSQVPATLEISVDGKVQPSVTIQNSQLYTLFDSNDYSDHTIEIIINQKGFEAYTFTFG